MVRLVLSVLGCMSSAHAPVNLQRDLRYLASAAPLVASATIERVFSHLRGTIGEDVASALLDDMTDALLLLKYNRNRRIDSIAKKPCPCIWWSDTQ